MGSEGVGSYWPFATGQKIDHANMLLKQIIETPRTNYTLVPNQHIGVWKVGFKPQLLMREYLTRRGAAKLKSDQVSEAKYRFRNLRATPTSRISTGTSTRGPITAAKAAPWLIPKVAIATAMASSKLLEAAVNDRVADCS